ncbi:MAG: hypothetical protein RDV48_27700 [Candidatus Eremiobacteraeota bacterium]|nr:hypothetical protein [Candidatus Eremiobacteraeota bacterium]
MKIENTPFVQQSRQQAQIPIPAGESGQKDVFTKEEKAGSAAASPLDRGEKSIPAENASIHEGTTLTPREYIDTAQKTIDPKDVRKARKASGPPPREGTKKSFWRWNFAQMPPGFKKIDATCQKAGKNCYAFVEDACWGKEVKAGDIEKLLNTFENQTPPSSLNPKKGIYDVDTETFGNIPDALDNDPRVYLFVTNLGNYQGQGFDGYFNAFDEMDDATAWEKYHQHSNEAEMLYLNCGSRETPIASDYMLSVTSHELQHMIHFNYDSQEESWLNESCSEAAMTATGYFTDSKHMERYASNPSSPLMVKDFVDYGACLLWGTYLMEQLGAGFFPALVSNPSQGALSINDTLSTLHRPENFRSLFDQWVVANFASSRGVTDSRYRYSSFPVPPMKVAAPFEKYPAEHSSTLKSSGVDYIALNNTDNKEMKLSLKVTSPENPQDLDYGVQLMRFNGKELKVEPLRFKDGEATVSPGDGELFLAVYGLGEKDLGYTISAEKS